MSTWAGPGISGLRSAAIGRAVRERPALARFWGHHRHAAFL